MAIKRSSRTYVDDTSHHHHDSHQRKMASAYISRRSSWNSLGDESVCAAGDMEAGQPAASISREPLAAPPSRSQNLPSNRTEPPVTSMSADTIVEKSSAAAAAAAAMSSISLSMLDSPDYPRLVADRLPTNFGLVVPGVYRSSYPKPEDYGFLAGLKLKTVVTLVKREEVDEDLLSFIHANEINQVVFDMKGTKKEAIPTSTMRAILELVLDRGNYPLLLHCNHGKHRTGCVVAVVRRLSGWQLPMVLDEYKTYAQPKIRDCDVEYINDFQCTSLSSLNNLHVRKASSTPVQVRTFFRALLFSTVVTLLWLVSGSQLPRIDGVTRH